MKLALIILMLPALAAAQGVEYTDAQVYNHYRSNLGSSAYYIGFEVASLCMLVPECKAKAEARYRAAVESSRESWLDKITPSRPKGRIPEYAEFEAKMKAMKPLKGTP